MSTWLSIMGVPLPLADSDFSFALDTIARKGQYDKQRGRACRA